jgi:hypothetical protein
MLAAIAGRAGILKLKMLHTVNISAALIPGRAIAETCFQPQAASFKRRATSNKPQASSYKLQAFKFIVDRFEPQAASFKPQAISCKRQAARAFIKFFISVRVAGNLIRPFA